MSKLDLEGGMIENLTSGEVTSLARAGVSWTFLLTLSKNIFSMGSTAVLARILSPDDYGLIGMVATLTVLLTTFQDMGLSWVTLQRKNISKAQADNLFWVNSAFGILLWPLCIPGGYLLEMFYGRQELRLLVPAMGIMFLIDGIGAQPKALLTRSLKIKSLSIIEISSHVFGIGVAICGAFSGWTYWAIVAQGLVTQATRMVWSFIASGYRPKLPKRGVGTRSLLQLGGAITGFGLITYFSRNVDNLLIGKYWGASELGYYTRAYFLMTLPSQIVTASFGKIMIPTLSNFRDDSKKLESIYQKTFQAIAIFSWPIALGLTLTSSEVVNLIYGAKWAPVVPILFWLSLASLSQTIYHTTGWLFVTIGNGRLMLRWATINTVILIGGFFYGVGRGGVGVAQAYFILSTFVLTIPALYITHRPLGMRLAKSLNSLVPVVKSCLVMSFFVISLDYLLNRWGIGWQIKLAAKVFCGVVTYAAAIVYFIKIMPTPKLQKLRDKYLSR